MIFIKVGFPPLYCESSEHEEKGFCDVIAAYGFVFPLQVVLNESMSMHSE